MANCLGVITDPVPRNAKKRDLYLRSDGLTQLPLPPVEAIRTATQIFKAAMQGGDRPAVGNACNALVTELARFYGIPAPSVKVLGIRPHVVTAGVCTYQLFGDYTPSTQRIRVWMRTAIRAQVSSPKALLNTLLHEFCHHLDATHFNCPDSPHTRGFFVRVDHLYHRALETPADARRPLHWIQRGARWQIDWRRLRAGGGAAAARVKSRSGA
jgi:hypothetical protein